MPAMVAGKWFLTVVALAHASSLPMDEKAERECSPDDQGCMAREEACSLAKQMASDWPLQYANMRQTYRELTDVCAGRPLDFTDTPDQPLDVLGTNPEVLSNLSTASHGFQCSDPASCITNVVKYESDNPGAKWAMKSGKFAAKFGSDTLKEILKAGGNIALKGVVAFAFVGAAISAFFPGKGGLPVNPCTFAEAEDWGRCVWEQVKPFVQEFVEDQLDDAFGDLWDATINGYKTRLWALNATVYHNSKLYPNGTIEEMSNATRDRMYEDLKAVHDAMLGSIELFLTDRAIKTTAGAYLSQFASLHFSVITNLLGSLKYRTAGDHYVFQTVLACYARRVYERATAAFKSRMSAVEAHEEDHGWSRCCSTMYQVVICNECYIVSGEFKDTWKSSCDWKNSGYHTICALSCCILAPDMFAMFMARDCYQRHREEVANQAVQFWQNWLTPLPIWLDSIADMHFLATAVHGAKSCGLDEAEPNLVQQAERPCSSGFGCILAMPAMVAGKWFLTVVSLAHASSPECEDAPLVQLQASLPMDEKAERECSPDDLGCMAREEACSLAKQMASDWPLQYANMKQTYRELKDVCAGRPLDSTDTPEEPLDVPGTNPEVLSNLSTASAEFECSDPASCITNVVKYEKDWPGAKWAMRYGKFSAKAASDTLKECLKELKYVALQGVVAFAFVGAAISAFFPSAGGLPVNPCTFATEDWARCVWEQVKPFVQEFVEDQLDEAFEDLWDATVNGYKTRLWALNATVYRNSKLYPNGTIEEMSNATRDRMYEDLKAVHDAMLGSIQLFLTDRAIKTTAGAYLSQFASLHFSVIAQLLGSLTYRTAGDRYVFQTVGACYARRVYERATAAFKSRMSAVEAHEEDKGEFKDTWKLSCDWKNTGYYTICLLGPVLAELVVAHPLLA
ncbi:SPCC736.13, partial [Symbiodinium microadriaticum]